MAQRPAQDARRYPTVRGDRPDADFALRNACTSAGESAASAMSPRAGVRWSPTTYRYETYVRGRTVTRATSVSHASRKAPTVSTAPAAGRPGASGPSAPRSRSRTADRVRARNEGGAVSRAGRTCGARSSSKGWGCMAAFSSRVAAAHTSLRSPQNATAAACPGPPGDPASGRGRAPTSIALVAVNSITMPGSWWGRVGATLGKGWRSRLRSGGGSPVGPRSSETSAARLNMANGIGRHLPRSACQSGRFSRTCGNPDMWSGRPEAASQLDRQGQSAWPDLLT
jgi:hypothetical protein